MNTETFSDSRKRPVNLTLNEQVVAEARMLAGNLSAKVEELLTDYVEREHSARQQRRQEADACCQQWNAVLDAWGGSFADEHSTL